MKTLELKNTIAENLKSHLVRIITTLEKEGGRGEGRNQ